MVLRTIMIVVNSEHLDTTTEEKHDVCECLSESLCLDQYFSLALDLSIYVCRCVSFLCLCVYVFVCHIVLPIGHPFKAPATHIPD